jgi:hypothetical protein
MAGCFWSPCPHAPLGRDRQGIFQKKLGSGWAYNIFYSLIKEKQQEEQHDEHQQTI